MQKVDKRFEILKAAERLFSEFGYEGTSTRQIAKESGANMAMINYYFGGKEGVFLEIMEERISGFKSQLDAINDEKISAKEKLKIVVAQYTTRIFSNISFHKMMHRELSLTQRPEMYTKIKDAMDQNLSVIEAIINKGIADGIFRNVDVRLSIMTIMGTITMAATAPYKIISAKSFDIKNEKDRETLKDRLILHLQDLILTHLSISK